MSRKRVITERDIRRAKADGKTSIDVGDAIVTPSAREVAAVLRMTLAPGTAEPRPAAPSRRPPASHVKQRAQPPQSGKGSPSTSGTAPAAPKARPSVAIGADHGGVALKAAIVKRLRELGHDVADVGTNSTDAVDYPDFAEKVARMVGEDRATFGIMIDGAGIGSCMAANKVARVRAAMCYDVTTAANAREHNFANVLTLGAGLIGERLALGIVETFLSTPTGAERHAARVAKIDALDRRG